jgi:hypothetical protein
LSLALATRSAYPHPGFRIISLVDDRVLLGAALVCEEISRRPSSD